MNFIHIYNMYFFCVLILKVVIYFEPLLVIVLKNLSAGVCHTSSLTYDHHGLNI